MTTLRLGTTVLPTAAVGAANPLPPTRVRPDLHSGVDGAGLDDEMRAGLRHGHVRSLLPYLDQDDYGRDRRPGTHRVAVLENDVLRAEFLLDLGGRLRSLVHKPSGRELLYRNAAVQPANLALRDAWFAGGVEWNVGVRGHSPLTCSPLHAGRVDGPDGVPVLRMWELERVRGVLVQIDSWLPVGSEHLLVSVRVTNPADVPVPMYWWSNVAVAEGPDVRVIAPATSAWRFDYGSGVDQVPFPASEGTDRSYPARADAAADWFLRVDTPQRPWIAAVDGTGAGLVQSSTPELRGRKLFVWGRGSGGRRWQQWLSPEGGDYLEIQAGLARTQLEHVPMPAATTWSWVETYGLVEADRAVVHGPDWAAARAQVVAALAATAPDDWLASRRDEADAFASAPVVEPLHDGSGWGALEDARRRRAGEPPLGSKATPFAERTIGVEQEPWLALLRHGTLPASEVDQAPSSYQVGDGWRPLLECAGSDWLTLLHLGVARWHDGDLEGAEHATLASLVARSSAWAWRNLAVLRAGRHDHDGADEAYRAALALAPGHRALVREHVAALSGAGRAHAVLDVVDSLSREGRHDPEVRFAETRAAVDVGDLDRADRVLAAGLELPGLREGDQRLGILWDDLQAARLACARGVPITAALRTQARSTAPLPAGLDFRMAPGSP